MRLSENLEFIAYDKNPKNVYSREVEGRRLAQKVWPGHTVTGNLKKDYRTSNTLGFEVVKPDSGPIKATLDYEMERVYYSGIPGYWVFDFGFDSAKTANVTLTELAPGSRAWLYDSSIGGKIIATCEGNGSPCILVAGKKIDKPRLIISGVVPADPYQPGVVGLFKEADVEAKIQQNSTLQLSFTIKGKPELWYMPILNERETFVARTSGAYFGKFERYAVNANLYSARESQSITADLLPTFADKERGGYFDIAIGSLEPISRIGGMNASSAKALYTDYNSIKIHLPFEKKILAEVILCKDNWTYSYTCEHEKQLLSTFTQTGNIAEVKLLEPAIESEIVVRIFTPYDSLTKPDAWTEFTYQLRHYWKYGMKPGWLHLIFMLVYLVLAVAGIIFSFRLVGYLREKAANAKERAMLQKTEAAAIDKVLKHDAKFDLEAFRTRASEIATRIQHSWCAGDMRDCRRYLSQGVYNRFRLQLKIMRELEKRRNIMADFEIRRFFVVAHSKSGEFDCLTVRMDAAARDIMAKIGRPDDDALRAAKKAPLNPFTEFYSFMRRREATTDHPDRIDSCSHCGTPFKGEGELNKCKSCGAIAGSGTFDWVLAEITQASEYRGPGARQNLTSASSDRIEDRASFVFWRDIMAALTQNKNYIVRDATDTYLAGELKPQSLYDIAVGAADLESFKANSSEAIAKVRIKWSAAALPNTKVRHRQSVITLRAQNTHLNNAGFAEHSCASCGAPLPETDSIECSYCHSPIQGKNADWLLDSVETKVE